jgi:anti-sigma28 factor (negative regulator of flagellin synthesis)
LAQLGAGIAQGDIGAGLTGATKVITDERDRKSREEYYKALTEKASRGSVTLYEDALKLAYEILSKDPMTAFEGVDAAKADALARQIMSGQFDMSALQGSANNAAVNMSGKDKDVAQSYIDQAESLGG